jgi:hypothetical protein
MPMREDCKYFQSRAYPSGDVARFCVLDLAPEAPWRCPTSCRRYVKRIGDAGFVTGGLEEAAPPPEPDLHPDAAAVLGSAEEIITAVAPEIAREETIRRQEEERRRQPTRWQKWLERAPRWRR